MEETVLKLDKGEIHQLLCHLGSHSQCDGRENRFLQLHLCDEMINWTFYCKIQCNTLTGVISVLNRAASSLSRVH